MYAQCGHGKRSSYSSDDTFGAWRVGLDGESHLMPVGKAYFGFADEELRQLDQQIRDSSVRCFGPVREVRAALVLEVAFNSVLRSSRHKSGLALRFPRIHRIRWDKPAAEADRVEGLVSLVTEQACLPLAVRCPLESKHARFEADLVTVCHPRESGAISGGRVRSGSDDGSAARDARRH